jgi:hypothetical protein
MVDTGTRTRMVAGVGENTQECVGESEREHTENLRECMHGHERECGHVCVRACVHDG